ncbi:MAG TPA: PilZ domain-containing protein [Candidatus Dormibacteraeota bacterium]|nr:PilZ domain-containing protein [Candidatus Dormibacteraeota bacterium]
MKLPSHEAVLCQNNLLRSLDTASSKPIAEPRIVNNVISMDDRVIRGQSRTLTVRDRRYSIRYPLAVDAELINLQSGDKTHGVTSDLSFGGCFVCTSRTLPVHSRIKLSLTRKDQVVESLAIVRVVKQRIGMGIEFIDVAAPYSQMLSRWIESLRRSR